MYLHKIESPFYQSFENMVVSFGFRGRSLLFTALQDYVPATFKKNSCPLPDSCHPLILCIIFVLYMLMNQLIMVINMGPFLTCAI